MNLSRRALALAIAAASPALIAPTFPGMAPLGIGEALAILVLWLPRAIACTLGFLVLLPFAWWRSREIRTRKEG